MKYLVVCESTHDNKILKFGADKIWEFWQSKTSFANLLYRVADLFGQTNMQTDYKET